MARDDFTRKIIDGVAKRAGMRCSNPECRQPTSGPSEEPTRTVNVGVAAHITAAAPGGPRYDSSLLAQQRTNIANAIWLCQNCAKLVDSDVDLFDVKTLSSWKKEAELRAIEELKAGPNLDAKQSINAAVVIQGEGAIKISGPNAVNIAPGGIKIVGPIVQKPNEED